MIKYVLLFLVVVFCCVNAADWEARFLELEKESNELSESIKGLNSELLGVYADINKLDQKENEVKGSVTVGLNEIRKSNTEYLGSFQKKFQETYDEKIGEMEKHVKDTVISKKFTEKFKNLIRNLKKYKKGYDKSSASVRKEVTKGNEKTEKSLTLLEGLKEPLVDKLKKIIPDLTPAEKIKREKDIKEVQNNFYKISRKVQMDAFHEEEKQRSDGNSGIKQTRTRNTGEKNYFSNTHTGRSFSAIHSHTNNIRTVGMGEFIGVLNGVEFRTRHNDYRLNQPARNDKRYHRTESVKFPPVPEDVLKAGDVDAQAQQMRKWFKAFHEQDYSELDYRPYFKAIMVYLEGAWIVGAAGDPVDEPFESDRHHIDATSWLDLQEKVRFTSYAGAKSLLENLAHLPTKIIRFTEDNKPVIAQWNYRLVCHPIEGDLPTSYLKLVPDITSQKRNKMMDEQYKASRAARFDLYGIDQDGKRVERPMAYSFMDTIMEQIPGKDNYGSYIEAVPFGDLNGELRYANSKRKNEKLNAAYYHRAFRQYNKDNEEVKFGQRGFSDNLYVAHTTQDRVARVSYNVTHEGETRYINTKVSYAVPVEIIYLTPLSNWNPYNLQMGKCEGLGTKAEPFENICSKKYYITPSLFYKGVENETDPADTVAKGASLIKTESGVKAVRAAGVRIKFPSIEGIESFIRQRYPIMPVFGEGSAAWKKLDALEEILQIKHINERKERFFKTGISHSEKVTGHKHRVKIGEESYFQLLNGKKKSLKVTAETANGHVHTLIIAKNDAGKIYIKDCDENWKKDRVDHPNQVCHDYHQNILNED